MIDMVFVYTVFMVTLGPIKLVPAFQHYTKGMEPSEIRALAARGALLATVISLAIAFVMPGIAQSWHVAPDDLRIAGGVLLFASAFYTLHPHHPVEEAPKEPRHPALSPVAIPMIITPWGAAAIMIAMGIAGEDQAVSTEVLFILLQIMALNLLGMLFARHIFRFIDEAFFKVVGWVFSVAQAGLATHIFLQGLMNIGQVAVMS